MQARMKFAFLALTALTVVSTACSSGKSGDKATDSGTKSPSPSTAASASASASPAANPYKDKLDLKFFLNSQVADANLPAGDKDFVKKAIEEKFNVSLNVTYMPMGTDRTNKLNLMMASGDAPDFFITAGTDSQKYVLDKVAADMTPYVTPQNMPNYFKWINETELKRYQIENVFARAPVGFVRDVWRSYYVRKDWLDKLNLKMPVTYDDMMNVMRAFTNNDPDGNGKKDTYGFGAVGNGIGLSTDFPQYAKNGLPGAFMVENNKLVDIQTDPRMEAVMNDIKAMIKEGLVDPDWYLAKGTQHFDKAAQGKIGVVLSLDKNFAFDSNPASILNKTKSVTPTADWEPFNPFATTGTTQANLPDDAFQFSKTTAEKNPEKIKRVTAILDWLASEEGYLLTHYGQEGKHYTRSGKTITLKPDAIQADITSQGNFLLIWGSFIKQTDPLDVLGLEVIDPRMTDRDRAIVKTVKAYKVQPSIGTNVAPPAGFNLADFRAKMREYQSKIVLDEKDASNWPKYREELMTKYKGNDMIATYEAQIKAAGVIK